MPANYPESWGGEESQLWEEISRDHRDDFGRMADDEQAMALFSGGWLDDGLSREDRTAIRDAFFDYLIEEGYDFDRDDFDWVAWREYMGY